MLSNKTLWSAICCVLILLVLCLCACGQQDKAGGSKSPAGLDARERDSETQDADLGQLKKNDIALSVPWQIVFSPEKPTSSDAIRAIVKSDRGLPADVTYKYVWEVNQKVIENATGDSLSNEYFKKKDVVSVLIKVSAGELGVSYKRRTAVIAGSRPTLEISTLTSEKKESIVLQVSGIDPDGGKLSYALEPPIIDGMEMDAETGSIRWKIPQGFLGKIQFKVMIMKADGEKFFKSFDLTVSDKPVTVRSEKDK